MIAESTGAELFSIQTVEKYPASYDETVDQGQQERNADVRPELTTLPENLDAYDVIFLGFPNWWGDMPMAMYSFLEQVDLSGKTIVPFVTSGGSGFGKTVDGLRGSAKGAEIVQGKMMNRVSKKEVEEWVNKF